MLPTYVPASMRKIEIAHCRNVKSVQIEHFEESTSLEELKVYNCQNITHLLVPSYLELNERFWEPRRQQRSIVVPSPYVLHLSCDDVASIDLQKCSGTGAQDQQLAMSDIIY
jgi:hypothetical protein